MQFLQIEVGESPSISTIVAIDFSLIVTISRLLDDWIASKKQPFISTYASFMLVAPSGNHSVKPLSAVSATVNIP
ncbi:MAG: hypothetical protein CL988_01625 [Euryarchaeota archaeon]|nr:hypothetical protein [Euryarchaeota archaeon]